MPSRVEGAAGTPRPANVPGRSLAAVAAEAGVTGPPASWGTLDVRGVTHDSRLIRPGDLYAALPGSRAHGARFAAAAARAGAVAVLTDKAGADLARSAGLPVVVIPSPRSVLGRVAGFVYGEPASSLLLVGITGTSGKTTTSYLIESGLRAAGHVTGLVGTVETLVAGDAMHSGLTTPESTDLHALFALMRERGVTAATMEVSSHALAYGRVDGITFDVAAFTNLSHDHLDFHRDMADYFAAKRGLFTPERARVGVVNVDDAYGRVLAREAPIPIVTVSPSGTRPADWTGAEPAVMPPGTTFTVLGPGGTRTRLSVNIPGSFNVENATLALATLVTAGMDRERAAAGITAHRDVPGRMERVEAGQQFLAIVDYAHKPDAVANVLDALRSVADGRLIAVLGCGGDRDPDKRPMMGEAAARAADILIVTDDNPRSEDPAAIRAAAIAGARRVPAAERAEIVEIGDRRSAIAHAVRLAVAGDVVAVLGKGHEAGQERAGLVVPFDDREELRRAIEGASA